MTRPLAEAYRDLLVDELEIRALEAEYSAANAEVERLANRAKAGREAEWEALVRRRNRLSAEVKARQRAHQDRIHGLASVRRTLAELQERIARTEALSAPDNDFALRLQAARHVVDTLRAQAGDPAMRQAAERVLAALEAERTARQRNLEQWRAELAAHLALST